MKQQTLITMPRLKLRSLVRLKLRGFELRQKARDARRRKKNRNYQKRPCAEQETLF